MTLWHASGIKGLTQSTSTQIYLHDFLLPRYLVFLLYSFRGQSVVPIKGSSGGKGD